MYLSIEKFGEHCFNQIIFLCCLTVSFKKNVFHILSEYFHITSAVCDHQLDN